MGIPEGIRGAQGRPKGGGGTPRGGSTGGRGPLPTPTMPHSKRQMPEIVFRNPGYANLCPYCLSLSTILHIPYLSFGAFLAHNHAPNLKIVQHNMS